MNKGIGRRRAEWGLAIAAVTATILLGTWLRLVDPLSNPVVPAEDPYTHMAYVREHLRAGDLEPLNPGTGLYPPGLHGFLAAVWAFTGADLYEIVRLGPVIFGAIGILGMALLLWRHAGPVAAFVGSLGLAVAPEAIFRTTMMSPTAQDLALVPFLLYALLEIAGGRLAWAAAAVPLALFLVFAHPWLFAILACAGVVFVALAFLLPWRSPTYDGVHARGLAANMAIVGGGLGLALTSCGGSCGPGFVDLAPGLAGQGWLAWLIIGLSLTPLSILLARPGAARWFEAPRKAGTLPILGRLSASITIAGLLVLVTWTAQREGIPQFVDLPRMIGFPLMVLAGLALIMLPFFPSRLGLLGAGLFVATYPLVIFNPLDSPFWPHRTVVFLALALAILAGLAAGAIADWATKAISAHRAPITSPGVRSRRVLAATAAFVVVLACAGSVYGGTPDGYPGGWYRLYPSCELEGLKDLSSLIDASPSAVVFAGAWQAKLVLSALTEDVDRLRSSKEFYTDAEARDEELFHLEREGHLVFAVVDRYLLAEDPAVDTAFLDEAPWERIGSWCERQGTGHPRLVAYRLEMQP